MTRLHWTQEELKQVRARLKAEVIAQESLAPADAKPLPPMTVDEARDWIGLILTIAEQWPLTPSEAHLHGQLLCIFMHAVRAETLGRRGRYFVIHESEVAERVRRVAAGN